jgi:hypothetical protein
MGHAYALSGIGSTPFYLGEFPTILHRNLTVQKFEKIGTMAADPVDYIESGCFPTENQLYSI